MNIFSRELKAGRRALIIWCVCMALGVLSGMAKYTAYSSGGVSSRALMELPQSLRALLGMGSVDPTTTAGFYALLYFYLAIAAALHAALLGSGILGKEERDKTAEFLMAKPVSRTEVITAKLMAALVEVVIFNLVTAISSIGMVDAYNKGKDITGLIAVFMLEMLIVQLIFLSLGFMTAAAMKRPAKAGSLVSGIVVGTFILSEITSLNPKLDFLNIFSPFKYFSVSRIVDGGGLNPAIVCLSLLLAAAFTALTYRIYPRRDLNV